MTVNVALICMGDGEYLIDIVGDAPQAEAGGYACFNVLLEALETIGVVLIKEDEEGKGKEGKGRKQGKEEEEGKGPKKGKEEGKGPKKGKKQQ